MLLPLCMPLREGLEDAEAGWESRAERVGSPSVPLALPDGASDCSPVLLFAGLIDGCKLRAPVTLCPADAVPPGALSLCEALAQPLALLNALLFPLLLPPPEKDGVGEGVPLAAPVEEAASREAVGAPVPLLQKEAAPLPDAAGVPVCACDVLPDSVGGGFTVVIGEALAQLLTSAEAEGAEAEGVAVGGAPLRETGAVPLELGVGSGELLSEGRVEKVSGAVTVAAPRDAALPV